MLFTEKPMHYIAFFKRDVRFGSLRVEKHETPDAEELMARLGPVLGAEAACLYQEKLPDACEPIVVLRFKDGKVIERSIVAKGST